MIIKKDSSMEAWKASLNHIMQNGQDYIDHNNRKTKEILNFVIDIENKDIDIAKPIERVRKSLKWQYPPLIEIESNILSKKLPSAYSYSYGPRVFNHNNLNQIDDYIIPLLKKDPHSRRAIVMIWDPITDSSLYTVSAPGLVLIDFKLRDNKLHAACFVRSDDIFFGWPANIYQIHILSKYIAKNIGCELGRLCTFASSAQVFGDVFDNVQEILDEK